MADEETNEGENTEEGEEDSAPFVLMRTQRNAAVAELEVIKAANAEAETAAQQQRDTALEAIVIALGIPNLKQDLLGWVEGEITEESVDAALKAKGLNFVKEEGIPPTQVEVQQSTEPVVPVKTLVPASTLGQQVADAASGVVNPSLDEAIAAAETPGEIEALMKQAGAAVEYQ